VEEWSRSRVLRMRNDRRPTSLLVEWMEKRLPSCVRSSPIAASSSPALVRPSTAVFECHRDRGSAVRGRPASVRGKGTMHPCRTRA